MKPLNTFIQVLIVLAVGLAAGCATPPGRPEAAKKNLPKYVFFPPAPDEPHIQFLTSFQTEQDLKRGMHASFTTYLTGLKPKYIPISKPYGGFAGNGVIYVCDTAQNSILKLDFQNHRIGVVSPNEPAALQMPVNLTIDSDGTMYVVDLIRQQLVILDKNGNVLGLVGEKGKNKPMDVAVTADRIYLSDSATHNVHVLDKVTRKTLFDIPRPEDNTDITHRMFQPINIALATNGDLVVSDLGASRVQVYDKDGKFVRSFGAHGNNAGEFFRNKGVAVDRNNYIYVADAAFDNVQIFNDQGRLLMPFGSANADQASMELPSKVLIDYDDIPLFAQYIAPNFQVEHLIIVLNQYGPNRVAVYGFGHKK
ncbi:MAG TPA: 6-bladed beta-propeller [Candidatus Sulfotelmatobacter sp.]|jgi:DNA-binding beta-propeller fold protein YncE|nr:6-bladed beta-propeller [Candidatus Sulfotelmatobacter sp.]